MGTEERSVSKMGTVSEGLRHPSPQSLLFTVGTSFGLPMCLEQPQSSAPRQGMLPFGSLCLGGSSQGTGLGRSPDPSPPVPVIDCLGLSWTGQVGGCGSLIGGGESRPLNLRVHAGHRADGVGIGTVVAARGPFGSEGLPCSKGRAFSLTPCSLPGGTEFLALAPCSTWWS